MTSFRIFLAAILVAFSNSLSAQDFFSKEAPSTLFDIGFRLGVNTSNRTFPNRYFHRWNVNSWGNGLDAGCVVNINIRDFIALQPGLFLESRSGDYAYSQIYFDADGESDEFNQMGHDRSYNITIPLLVSMRFNLASTVRLIAEAGPYIQYFFHDTSKDRIRLIRPQVSSMDDVVIDTAVPSKSDFGLKMGAGISYRHKYSFHIHYLAGFKHAWKTPLSGGLNKGWIFSIGYDL